MLGRACCRNSQLAQPWVNCELTLGDTAAEFPAVIACCRLCHVHGLEESQHLVCHILLPSLVLYRHANQTSSSQCQHTRALGHHNKTISLALAPPSPLPALPHQVYSSRIATLESRVLLEARPNASLTKELHLLSNDLKREGYMDPLALFTVPFDSRVAFCVAHPSARLSQPLLQQW